MSNQVEDWFKFLWPFSECPNCNIVLGMYYFDTYIDLIFLKPLLKVGQDGLGFDKSLCAGLYRASHRQATGGHRRGGHRRRAPRGHSYWNGRHTLQVSQVGVASRGLVHPSGKFQGRRRMVEVCKIDFQIMYPYFLIWGIMGQEILWKNRYMTNECFDFTRKFAS